MGEVVVNVRLVGGVEHAVGKPRNISVEDFREAIERQNVRQGGEKEA